MKPEMSELIARLLDEETDLADCAADCIEELERERDAALAAQAYTYIGKNMKPILARDLEDAKDAAEAKLAKAMAGLRKIADHKHFSWDQGWMQNAEARIASATLAELEGKNE